MNNESRKTEEETQGGGKVIPLRPKTRPVSRAQIEFNGIDLNSPSDRRVIKGGFVTTNNAEKPFDLDAIQNGPRPSLVVCDETETISRWKWYLDFKARRIQRKTWKRWQKSPEYVFYEWHQPRGLRKMYLEARSCLREWHRYFYG